MWDVLMSEYADGRDAQMMRNGAHYDYTTQQWVDGHDHAHFENVGGEGDGGPLVFCYADWASCGQYDPMNAPQFA